jgi:hypothetical protein
MRAQWEDGHTEPDRDARDYRQLAGRRFAGKL